MEDSYSHICNNIIYIEENIPGPSEESEAYYTLCQDFNSQLTTSCNCKNCLQSLCKCLELCGYNNYIPCVEKGMSDNIYKLNRVNSTNERLILECNSLCKCSSNCGNRLVQNGPINNLFVKTCENKLKGLGLYTSNFIAEGRFICEYAGELLTQSQAISRHRLNQEKGNMNYIFCLNEHSNMKTTQTFVDPSYFGNIGRYINHSCEPNCEIIPVRVNSPIPKVAIFSLVDILPGTEITFDYGVNNKDNVIMESLDSKLCLCNSKKCRKLMPFTSY